MIKFIFNIYIYITNFKIQNLKKVGMVDQDFQPILL